MKSSKKTFTRLAISGLFLIAGQLQAMTFGFADIDVANVVGTGANKSGLVIDFNDGAATERYIFQYNWNGSVGDVSGAEMLDAVAAAIPELSYALGGGTIADSGFFSTITYDTQSETSGDFVTNFDYWGYFIAGGLAGDTQPFVAGGTSVAIPGAGSEIPESLNPSPSGASASAFGDLGRFIANESWDVWSFGPDQPAYVVPEPSSFALFAGILSLIFVSGRRFSR